MTVPNGPADIATFSLSNTSFISLSANIEVNEVAFTSAATNPYFIDAADFVLTFSGTGIVNNSGFTQTFWTPTNTSGAGGFVFTNSSTAGTDVSILNNPGSTIFLDKSTAGNAFIENELGNIIFSDESEAGEASIFVDDVANLYFLDTSSAASADIGALGFIFFSDSSSGGTAAIELNAFGGFPSALDISTHNLPGVTIGSIAGGPAEDENISFS